KFNQLHVYFGVRFRYRGFKREYRIIYSLLSCFTTKLCLMVRLSLFFAFLLPSLLTAQPYVDLEVFVLNPKRIKMVSAEVSLVEKSSGTKKETKTDGNGKANFRLDEGKVWELYVNGTKM